MNKTSPCLSILKNHQFCDFYEAVYLFAGKNFNKDLSFAEIRPDKDSIDSLNECAYVQRPFVLRRPAWRHDCDWRFGTDNFPKRERLIVSLEDLWRKINQVALHEVTIFEFYFSLCLSRL